MIPIRLLAYFIIFFNLSSHAQLSIDRVFYRFYLLHRMQPSIDLFLRLVNQEGEIHKNRYLSSLLCSFEDINSSSFIHPRIQESLQHMCKYHDSAPLIKLIETVGHYRYIEDDEYVREILMLLLVVYKNMLLTIAPQQNLSIPEPIITQIVTTCSTMSNLSVHVLLDTLDDTADTLEQAYTHTKRPDTRFVPWAMIILVAGIGVATWFFQT